MKKYSVFSNLIWRFLERAGAQGVTFLVSIILARLLDPETYGLIALVTVFTSILQVFVDAGMGRALIQKKNADSLDFSSVFWFNLAFSTILYFTLFVVSPYIAGFYGRPSLTLVLRVQSLILIISAIKNVQQSYVSKYMFFKKFFFATLGGTVGAAVVGITMAYLGFGVWALVGQYLFNTILDTFILWIIVKWRPEFRFSFKRLKGLFSYGWKLLASALLDTSYRNVRSLLIGKVYTASDLAFYNRGNQFPNLFVTNINASIDSVLLPVMAKEQDNKDVVKVILRRAITTSTYIMAPMMMGLAACADEIVEIVLSEKWLPCVPYLRIFCVAYMFLPIHSSNLNAINAVGRSDLFFKLEIIKKIIELTVLFIAVRYGVMAIALSLLLVEVPNQMINAWPNKKLLKYSYFEQIRDILPAIILALFMGVVVYVLHFIQVPILLKLLLQILVGVLLYLGGSVVLKLDGYHYVLNIFEEYFKIK